MVHGRVRNVKKQNAVVKASRLPEPIEILSAVESLYEDQIRPSGRILRKRLLEVHAAEGPWDVDVQKLTETCSRMLEFEVLRESKDECWVKFVGRECHFVDIPGLEDPYPEQLWCNFQNYFDANRELSLPGGRYECARALLAGNLPFLAGYSLGDVCHMVQLAISTKKILGYNLGSIVPYGCSQSMEKEQCAASNVACSARGGHPASMPALSRADAKFYLQELLKTAPSTGIPLPNVKRLFKSRFNVQLSETALGYSKVSDLLQDPHFQDICVVKQQGQGYIVTQAPAQVINLSALLSSAEGTVASASSPTGAKQRTMTEAGAPKRVLLSDIEPLSFDEEELLNEPMVLVPTPSATPGTGTWALSPATLAKNGYARIERNTFIHLKLPSTPLCRPQRRSLTEPHDMGWKDWNTEVNGHSDDSTSEGSSASNSSTVSSREESPNHESMQNLKHDLLTPSSLQNLKHDLFAASSLSELQEIGLNRERVPFCPNEPLCFDDESAPAALPSPSPMKTPSRVTPGILRKHTRADKERRTVRFAIQEELTETSQVEAKANISSFQSVWTPGTCLKHGIRERNTFLDVAIAPATPLGLAAVHQAKSCGDIF